MIRFFDVLLYKAAVKNPAGLQRLAAWLQIECENCDDEDWATAVETIILEEEHKQ